MKSGTQFALSIDVGFLHKTIKGRTEEPFRLPDGTSFYLSSSGRPTGLIMCSRKVVGRKEEM